MASIPSNYEINVAKKRSPDDEYGIHFCKIELPIHDYTSYLAEEKLKFLRELFGDEYHLSMTYWKCVGENKKEWL